MTSISWTTVSAPTTFTGGWVKVTLRIFGATVSILNMLCWVMLGSMIDMPES
jgi:hypothetical protein